MTSTTPRSATPRAPVFDLAGANARIAEYRHGRVPRELRLQQVLAAAAELFATEGSNASMDDLASLVGVSKPVIYDLVGSKDELAAMVTRALADELRNRVVAAVASVDEPDAQLRAGILAFFEFVGEDAQRWWAFGRGAPAPFDSALDEIRRRQSAVVADLIELRLADRNGPGRREADALATALNGASEALAVWWLDHPDVSATALADLLTAMVAPGLDAFDLRMP